MRARRLASRRCGIQSSRTGHCATSWASSRPGSASSRRVRRGGTHRPDHQLVRPSLAGAAAGVLDLSERSASLDVFRACRHFGISVLPRSQEAVARRFADPGIADKFNGVATRRAFAGIRLIEGAVATFVCEAYRAWPVGDHLLLVGKVLQIDGGDDEPLVFHQGRFLSMRLTQMA